MLYLAYGSNINFSQMQARCPSAKALGQRKIFGMKLVFNKLGVDGTAKANVIRHPSLLHGMLYEISNKDLIALDAYEGCPSHYRRYAISTGKGEVFYIYVACRSKVSSGIRPSKEYKKIIVDGMIESNFPKYYVDKIKRVKAIRR